CRRGPRTGNDRGGADRRAWRPPGRPTPRHRCACVCAARSGRARDRTASAGAALPGRRARCPAAGPARNPFDRSGELRIDLKPLPRLGAAALAGASLSAVLGACAPLVRGGAPLGTALVATDRRSSGAQLDDQSIELRAGNRLRDQVGGRANVSVTSYNRQVLLTGEANSEAT